MRVIRSFYISGFSSLDLSEDYPGFQSYAGHQTVVNVSTVSGIAVGADVAQGKCNDRLQGGIRWLQRVSTERRARKPFAGVHQPFLRDFSIALVFKRS
jgi:hypothetical protein